MGLYLEIKLLNNNTVKLTLSNKDMKKHNITYEILNNNKNITKNLSLNLLNSISKLISINSIKSNIFIESFKTKEKGCIIYLSTSPTSAENKPTKIKTKTTLPIIATFKKKSNMNDFCKNISNLNENFKFKSELYSFNDEFVLIIFVPQEKKEESLALVKEFGKIYGKGNIKYSIIKEHCKPIFKKNSIENILKLT